MLPSVAGASADPGRAVDSLQRVTTSSLAQFANGGVNGDPGAQAQAQAQ
jgi:hypothetical protein